MGARFGDERRRLHRPRLALGAVLDTRRPVLGLNLRDLESPERDDGEQAKQRGGGALERVCRFHWRVDFKFDWRRLR
jgi:hypothetical protein